MVNRGLTVNRQASDVTSTPNVSASSLLDGHRLHAGPGAAGRV
jgi:hypothetical protein